jgi:phage shock protein PspC (stress-responsive transcriptional regulator)
LFEETCKLCLKRGGEQLIYRFAEYYMKKKLTKSSTDVVFTGTLGGIAEYFGIDSTFVRVAYVIFIFCGIGSPILIYILLMLVIPRAPWRGDDYNNQQNNYYSQQDNYYKSNFSDKSKKRKDVTDSIDDL